MDVSGFSDPSRLRESFSTPVEILNPLKYEQSEEALKTSLDNLAVQPIAQEHQKVCGIIRQKNVLDFPVSSKPLKHISSNSSISLNPICRICLEGNDTEALINPCHCMGTSAFLHLNCLKKWLAYSGTSECDLCRFQFQTTRKIKPIREWQKIDLSTKSKEYIRLSIAIFLVLTPSFVCGLILATEKLKVYIGTPENFWKAVGMTALSAFSVSVYLLAIGYCLKRYNILFREWIAANQKVTIYIPQKHTSKKTNKMLPVLEEVTVHM